MEEEILLCPRCGGHIGLMLEQDDPMWWSAHCPCDLQADVLVEIGASTRETLVSYLNQRK